MPPCSEFYPSSSSRDGGASLSQEGRQGPAHNSCPPSIIGSLLGPLAHSVIQYIDNSIRVIVEKQKTFHMKTCSVGLVGGVTLFRYILLGHIICGPLCTHHRVILERVPLWPRPLHSLAWREMSMSRRRLGWRTTPSVYGEWRAMPRGEVHTRRKTCPSEERGDLPV